MRDRNRSYHRARWIAQLHRYGLRPRIVLVQEVPLSCWSEAESYWIGHFRARGCRLTNSTDGGQGTLGHRHSDEARAKMSAAKKGWSNPRKGQQLSLSAEQRRQIAVRTRRQMADPSQRAAVSQVHKGKTLSEAQKRAVGDAAARRWAAWREEHLPNLPTLVARYEAGAHLYALAREAGVAVPTLRRAFEARDITIRGTGQWVRA